MLEVSTAALREPNAARGAGAVVRGRVNYLRPGPTKPAILIDPDGGRRLGDGARYETRTISVTDGRPIADRFSLDRSGVQLVRHETVVTDFQDETAIRTVYDAEVEALLKRQTGAVEVLIFDHTVRIDDGAANGVRKPVRNVHGDYTERSGPQRVRDLVSPDKVEDWLADRFAVINVWRPIKSPVETSPLAFIDGQSIAPEDFVAMDLVYPDRTGEIYGVTYNPNHAWYYFPKMTRNEALLLKTFDSATDGRVRFSAHAAFDDPTSRPDAPPRQSIEVRALVRFHND